MKLVRKFDDFVKNRKIQENTEPIATPESEMETEEGTEATEEMEMEDPNNIIDTPAEEEAPHEMEDEPEEEGGEYEGTVKLKQLSEMLGVPVQNNEINYNGHTINFYSETEKLHVDEKDPKKRKKFDNPEQVMEYLKSSSNEKPGNVPMTESRRFRRNRK
jgi:hypothetical protein